MRRSELADALAASGINGLAQAIAALRDGTQSEELADALEAIADLRAQRGDFDGFMLFYQAASVLRSEPEPHAGTVTGEFRALRSSVIGGVACTEYEGRDTARYVLAGLGQSEQPPELVRVWAADPDELGD
jgi:hypothetical protein